ncbi:MAG: hypothetical protein KME57_13715 [Scytonema hyalinum WJT4-NPBG1]|nr:hypothetical protein [Scytonema hyalinum WJT4-NPBG1]
MKVSLDLHITVGWVESNETQQNPALVGFHAVQTPLCSSRETLPVQVAPQPTILCAFKENWY